jgi:hypothetical protein
MGASGFSMYNRKTRVGNAPYQDTDEPTGLEHLIPGAATAESTQTDPAAPPSVERLEATSRNTGGTVAPAKTNVTSGGRRRKGTVAGDLFSNNTNSIL